jgi:hypothetical protein
MAVLLVIAWAVFEIWAGHEQLRRILRAISRRVFPRFGDRLSVDVTRRLKQAAISAAVACAAITVGVLLRRSAPPEWIRTALLACMMAGLAGVMISAARLGYHLPDED